MLRFGRHGHGGKITREYRAARYLGPEDDLLPQPEDRLGVVCRAEGLQILGLFAQAEEEDRQLELAPDADQGAAAAGAIELGHDHARQTEALVEDLGLLDGIAPERAVDHQPGMV